MQDAFGVTAFVASVVQLSLSRSLSFARVTAEGYPSTARFKRPRCGARGEASTLNQGQYCKLRMRKLH